MAHASESSVEPNLTPLLDLVLQLLMFFMITVNFTQGVTNTGESLPTADTVAPLDADGNDPLVLSVKPFGMGKGPWKLRRLSISYLRMDRMPEAVWKKLEAKMLRKPFDTQAGFVAELKTVLSDSEFAEYEKRILEYAKPRDDFKYLSDTERKRLSARFKEDETCILIPTEQLTTYEKDRGDLPEKLIRNMANTAERLKRIGQDERDLAARERKTYGKVRKARVDEKDNVLIPVHIRADEEVKTGDIYELMDACKEAGFVTIKARSLLGSGGKK